MHFFVNKNSQATNANVVSRMKFFFCLFYFSSLCILSVRTCRAILMHIHIITNFSTNSANFQQSFAFPHYALHILVLIHIF